MDLKAIGSVVRIKGATDKVMIIGHSRRNPANRTQVFDYVGVKYPEGYDGRRGVMFNDDMIDESFNAGYQDQETIFNSLVAAEKRELRLAEAERVKRNFINRSSGKSKE